MLPQYLFHVCPRREHPLTPGIAPAVEHLIQDLDPQMGHSDLVQVRKAHCKPDGNIPVLIDRMHLVPEIPGRFLYLQQQLLRQCQFSHPPFPLSCFYALYLYAVSAFSLSLFYTLLLSFIRSLFLYAVSVFYTLSVFIRCFCLLYAFCFYTLFRYFPVSLL